MRFATRCSRRVLFRDLIIVLYAVKLTRESIVAMQEADLIIALGARFDDRVTGSVAKFAPAAKAAASLGRGGIVHFEIMPKNINKVVQATVCHLGNHSSLPYLDSSLIRLPRNKNLLDLVTFLARQC